MANECATAEDPPKIADTPTTTSKFTTADDLHVEECAIPSFKSTDAFTMPVNADKSFQQLLEKYKDLFRNTPGGTTLAHHFIPNSGPPIRVPPRIPAEYRQEVEKIIKDM